MRIENAFGRNKMKISLWFFLPLLIALSGCAHNYQNDFLKDAQTKGWNEARQKAALEYSYRLLFLKKIKDEYKVKYSMLNTAQVREKLDEALKDVNELLSYKNEWDTKYVDEFQLRKSLEHTEQVLKARRDRIKTYELYGKFQQLSGAVPIEYSEEQLQEKVTGYNIQKIFLSTDPAQAFSFKMDVIEEARRRGDLKEIERGQLSLQRKFDRKEQNLANQDDPNDKVWKSKKFDLEIISYKILDNDNPENNESNYLEGYRVANGKKESLPALRLFYPNDGSPGIVAIDTDKEGEIGFGLPDLVEPVEEAVNAAEILKNDQLINLLFEEKKEEKRVPPKKKPLFVEIARIGDKSANIWETAPDEKGWAVPFRYQNELKNNYNIKLVFAKPEQSTNTANSFYKQIKYLKKEWVSGNHYQPSMGNVVEYYKMKPPYGKRNLVEAMVDEKNAKKLLLATEDGNEETIIIVARKNNFIEDDPARIDYTEGSKRWRIEREDSNPVFTKKKEISNAYKDGTEGQEME